MYEKFEEFKKDMEDRKIDVMDWLEEQTEDTIRNRIFNRISKDFDTAHGSYIYDAIEPTVMEITEAYFIIKNIIKLEFPQTSYGEFLTLWGNAIGVYRKNATYASGELLITAKKGTIILKGTKFSTTVPSNSTNEIKYFSTLKDIVFDNDQSINIEIISDIEGTKGNVKAKEINLNVENIKGIISIINEKDILNAVDEEDNNSLFERIKERVQHPPSSGNKYDYKRWTKEIAGVDDVIVKPLWNGAGTVKVIIIGKDGKPIPELINKVKEYLDPKETEGQGDGLAPVGAVVTVDTITNIVIDINITNLDLETGYTIDDIKNNLEMNLSQYILSLGGNDTIRIHAVENRITSTKGIKDFEDVFINDYKNNFIIPSGYKAILGVITYD